MKKLAIMLYLFLITLIVGCLQGNNGSDAGLASSSVTAEEAGNAQLMSPSGMISARIDVTDESPTIEVFVDGDVVLAPSILGLDLQDADDLAGDFAIVGVSHASANTTWRPVWGTASEIRDNYNSIIVEMQETAGPNRLLNIEIRAYDDGVAFRYEIPQQPSLQNFVINDEYTQFNFAPVLDAFIGIMRDDGWGKSQQVEYPDMSVGEFPAEKRATFPALVNTGPAWVAITEAAVVEYADALLEKPAGAATGFQLRLNRAPGESLSAVPSTAPRITPWRVLMISDHPGKFMESNLIANLNEPVAINDTSWIKPGKALWPWWNGRLPFGEPSTAQMQAYIDFCADVGIDSIVVDAGWYSTEADAWDDPDAEDVFTMEESRVDTYDIHEVLAYAKEKQVDVHLWVHGATLHRQMDDILPAFQEWGVAGIKADSWYGGDRGDYDSVQYFHDLLRRSAEHKIMINHHGWYKPTGVSRTYPHLLTREGVLGLEHAKWSDKPTIKHNVMLAYTRGILGQMDYTPGAFDLVGTEDEPKQVQGTRAAQLAMYVVYFSPFQMLPDSPDVYAANMDDFKFLLDVPTVWDETRFLLGDIGEYVAVARRSGSDWYVGALNGETPRSLTIALNFLPEGTYKAEVYQDAENVAEDRESVQTLVGIVRNDSEISALVGAGGGVAVRLVPASNDEKQDES